MRGKKIIVISAAIFLPGRVRIWLAQTKNLRSDITDNVNIYIRQCYCQQGGISSFRNTAAGTSVLLKGTSCIGHKSQNNYFKDLPKSLAIFSKLFCNNMFFQRL